MEYVSSVRPTGKFPEKVENLKRWSRFPGWNFRTECRVPLTFLVVCTSSRSTVGHPATYRGLRPNGTTFYQSEIPLLLPPKFPGFFRKWKAPVNMHKGYRLLPSFNNPLFQYELIWGQVHSLFYEHEFYLHENEKSFSYQRLSTWPRFETEARENSEMSHC